MKVGDRVTFKLNSSDAISHHGDRVNPGGSSFWDSNLIAQGTITGFSPGYNNDTDRIHVRWDHFKYNSYIVDTPETINTVELALPLIRAEKLKQLGI